MTLTDSRPMGGAYALDGLWRMLGIDTAIRDALAGKRADATRVERIVFGLTANRALRPSFKLAATDWIAHDVESATRRPPRPHWRPGCPHSTRRGRPNC